MKNPFLVGDGECDEWPYNSKACDWDGGDCDDRNAAIRMKYPTCTWEEVGWIGGAVCNRFLNVPECGYDDGACEEFNRKYPDCDVSNPFMVGDGECHLSHHVKSCGWDGGDCIDISDILNRYPECTWNRPGEIGDGYCDEEANLIECGFDDGDCE